VPHRQEIAILGVEQEQQAIEKAQCGFTCFAPPRGVSQARLRIVSGKCIDELREDLVENSS
jgi:hypothetical protein